MKKSKQTEDSIDKKEVLGFKFKKIIVKNVAYYLKPVQILLADFLAPEGRYLCRKAVPQARTP